MRRQAVWAIFFFVIMVTSAVEGNRWRRRVEDPNSGGRDGGRSVSRGGKKKVKAAEEGTVRLVLRGVGDESAGKGYRLLPKAWGLKSADALPMYREAAKLVEGRGDMGKVYKLGKAELGQLRGSEAVKLVKQFDKVLELVREGSGCARCEWPAIENVASDAGPMGQLRDVARVVGMAARVAIARGRYDKAIGLLRDGMVLGQRIGAGPVLIQGLVGVSIEVLMLQQVEQYVQAARSPSLYEALGGLGEPLIDLRGTIEMERARVKEHPSCRDNPALQKTYLAQMEPGLQHSLVQVSKLDRKVAVLECVEAVRLYASKHGGKLPGRLSEAMGTAEPSDPMTGRAFGYELVGNVAILTAAKPEGWDARESLRYELTVGIDNEK